VAKILIAQRTDLTARERASLVTQWQFHLELMVRARELVKAWHEVARLDGPERFYEALESLEKVVDR
jgi:hypothetical protein